MIHDWCTEKLVVVLKIQVPFQWYLSPAQSLVYLKVINHYIAVFVPVMHDSDSGITLFFAETGIGTKKIELCWNRNWNQNRSGIRGIKNQLDIDMSPSTNIITPRLGLTHLTLTLVTFGPDPWNWISPVRSSNETINHIFDFGLWPWPPMSTFDLD